MVNEQNEPVLDGSTAASLDSKKQGILVQVASDTAGRPHSEAVQMLRERLSDAGISVEEEELQNLARSLPTVDNQETAENREARDAD